MNVWQFEFFTSFLIINDTINKVVICSMCPVFVCEVVIHFLSDIYISITISCIICDVSMICFFNIWCPIPVKLVCVGFFRAIVIQVDFDITIFVWVTCIYIKWQFKDNFSISVITYKCNKIGLDSDKSKVFLIFFREASPPKLRLDGASIVRFSGFSVFLMIDFLISP